ncbi:MAG: SpoVA/SpoVAEb family sporulation membrane protein [Clostridia bacterium]|nr:SpoVA/SpoVAEb family sporulation membrane protein [Clostridia bacterium]
MAASKEGKSKLWKDCLMAFLIGGLICLIAQGIKDFLLSGFFAENVYAFDEEGAAAITTLIMVFLGAFLTAINVYDNIGRIAGAGSIVPITGFANSIVSPAMEFRSEGHILGVGAQMFIVAGPVLVYGTSAAVLVGLIYFLLH